MEDKRNLKIEELESVAGGVSVSQLTQEEKDMYYALKKKFEQAVDDNKKGLCDDAVVEAANREYVEFAIRMNQKYS